MKAIRAAVFCTALFSIGVTVQDEAQIKAFLPDVSEVPPGAPAAIDGIWKLSLNGAEFRIQAGRAYAVTSYLHLLVLKVLPGMVTTKNIRRTVPGTYEGYDLPTLGPWKTVLQADNTLAGTVNGPLGSIPFKLTPIQIDDPDWLNREFAEASGTTVTPRTASNSGSIYPPSWEAR